MMAPGASTLDVSTAIAFTSLLGFAIQRVLEIFDPMVLSPVARWWCRRWPASPGSSAGEVDALLTDRKRSLAALASFLIGYGVASTTDFSLFAFLPSSTAAEHHGFDLMVTGLVLGAGTEGANTLVKYFGYVKDARRTSAAIGAAALQNEGASESSTLTLVPSQVRVAPGQGVEFAALDVRGNEVPALWSVLPAEGGRVTSNGLYQATALEGHFRIIAASRDGSAVYGIAEVEVTA